MMTLKEKLEVLESMGKKVVFNFDMDGCLAQWEVGCTYEKTWEPHYFLYRDLEVVLRDAVLLLMEAGYKCQATSAAYEDGTARQDKSDWLDNNGMKDLHRIFMPCGKNKADFILNYFIKVIGRRIFLHKFICPIGVGSGSLIGIEILSCRNFFL